MRVRGEEEGDRMDIHKRERRGRGRQDRYTYMRVRGEEEQGKEGEMGNLEERFHRTTEEIEHINSISLSNQFIFHIENRQRIIISKPSNHIKLKQNIFEKKYRGCAESFRTVNLVVII